jgi:hypothetical protein
VRDLFEAFEHWGPVVAFSKSVFWFGLFTAMHYFTLFCLTGTAVAVDLRLLGLVAKDQSATEFADELFPWLWTLMVLAIFSGFMLATVEAGDYYAAPTMRWKIFITLLAFLCTLFIRRSVMSWDATPGLPPMAKVMAVASIVLWLGAILAGNDIAAICGLG